MTTINLERAVDLCREADSFLVASHAGPDGDSIGSTIAMGFFLRALGKTDVICASSDPVPRIYDWMPGAVEIYQPDAIDPDWQVDLMIVLDVAQADRLGGLARWVTEEQRVLVLDHHQENAPCGTWNFIDTEYAATSEIVVDLYAAAGLPLDRDAATAAYVGLTTDTGSFRYGNTNEQAHRHAAELVGLGVDVSGIANRVFDVISMPKLELMRRVLARVERSACERYAWSYLTARDLSEADADSEDVEGLVNFLRNLEGIEIGVLFRELEKGKVKVSMRAARPFNAGQILKPLGGGGHPGAAGAKLHEPLDQAMDAVLSAIDAALGEPAAPRAAAQGLD